MSTQEVIEMSPQATVENVIKEYFAAHDAHKAEHARQIEMIQNKLRDGFGPTEGAYSKEDALRWVLREVFNETPLY